MPETPISEGFAAEWVRVQDSVAVFVASAGPGFHDTEDIVQRVATIAFEKYAEFDPRVGSFLGWTVGIARNQVLHWRRGVGRDRHTFSPELVEQLADAQVEQAGELAGVQNALLRCIEQVRGRSRRVLELRYLDDQKPAEIAAGLNTSSASIRVTLSRARKTLQRCVERRLGLREGAR